MADSTQISTALRTLKTLLARGWIQKTDAMDEAGNRVSVYDRRATRFCLGGGCLQASNDDGQIYRCMRDALEETLGAHWIEWNDAPGRTQAEVLAAIDVTIARLEAQ